jgi:glycerol uptake facilitator-like aquaporin
MIGFFVGSVIGFICGCVTIVCLFKEEIKEANHAHRQK